MAKTLKEAGVSFSWSNYLKTSKLLLTFAEYLKGLFVLITSLAAFEAVSSKNPWWVIISACVGYSLDQLTKFFAKVDAENPPRVISMEVPQDTEVVITVEIKPPSE